MKNFIQKGKTITITATADIVSGSPVVYGDCVGVASNDALANEQVVLTTSGVFSLAKANSAISVGKKVYLTSGGNITETETGNTFVGFAHSSALASDGLVDVRLA